MLPALFIPKSIRDEASAFARDTVKQALTGMFGLIEAALARRQSAAFAHEKALYHERMSQLLAATPLRIANRAGRVKRHARLGMRWSAKAYARDAALALACMLCPPGLAPARV